KRSDDARYLQPFPTRRSSDLGRRPGHRLPVLAVAGRAVARRAVTRGLAGAGGPVAHPVPGRVVPGAVGGGSVAGLGVAGRPTELDRKSTRLNSSHVKISYAVF